MAHICTKTWPHGCSRTSDFLDSLYAKWEWHTSCWHSPSKWLPWLPCASPTRQIECGKTEAPSSATYKLRPPETAPSELRVFYENSQWAYDWVSAVRVVVSAYLTYNFTGMTIIPLDASPHACIHVSAILSSSHQLRHSPIIPPHQWSNVFLGPREHDVSATAQTSRHRHQQAYVPAERCLLGVEYQPSPPTWAWICPSLGHQHFAQTCAANSPWYVTSQPQPYITVKHTQGWPRAKTSTRKWRDVRFLSNRFELSNLTEKSHCSSKDP